MKHKVAALVAGIFGAVLFSLSPVFIHAETVSTDFESYSTGIINGQDGWSATGSAGSGCAIYDEGVSTNSSIPTAPASFGTHSFRISDAVTSGCFSDQAFSKPVANSAGESISNAGTFATGTIQSHFETQFDIAAVSPHSGDIMSVSPDRGDGARMSYLRFEDQTDGIHVYFYDVTDAGPIGTAANFNQSQIAVLDPSVAHTIKFSMDFKDGPANDVVKIYIDGTLRRIGTSWEDYYRYDPEQAGGGNLVPVVRTMLFRAGGTANPADAGNGFLIDNLSITSSASASAPSTNTVVVHPADLDTNGPSPATVAADGLNKWFFYNDENDTVDNTLGTFVAGPGTPPLGTGSAQITVTGTQRRNLATYQFGGIKLADITTLKFSTYNPSAGNGGPANRSAYLNFNVDFTGNSTTWQRRLAFVPNQNGTVTQDSWKEWDAIQNGNAKYSYSGSTWPNTSTGPDAGLLSVPGTTLRSWNDLLADYPGIRVLPGDSWLGLRVGEPYNDGYTENLDKFVLGTANGITQWDFDPAPAPTTAVVTIYKYVDGQHATAQNANNATFPFTATYNASNIGSGSDPFTIGATGNNVSTGNPYEAQTIPLALGASYSASENVTGNDVVGATCDDGKPFALAGYSSGDDFASALAAASSSTAAPQFTDLQSNKVVIVWNKSCPAAPPAAPQVHIFKFVDGVQATAQNNTATFPMNASWVSSTLGTVPSVGFTLSPTGWGSSDVAYEASYVGGAAGDNYATNEVLTGSVVGQQCDGSHTYSLDGYTTGETFDEAKNGTPSLDSPSFTNLQSDKYVIVWNKTCSTTASLTVTKSSIGGNGTFNFTSDIPGHASFQITTSNNQGSVTFDGIAPGTYHVSEVNQPKGWTQTDTSCDEVPLTAGQSQTCVVTDTSNKMLGSIRGSKYEDWDGDGSPFETKWEKGLKGWTITITGPNGFSTSTVTNKQGLYIFSGLPAGTYTVREVQQAGWVSTYPSANPAQDQWVVTLAAGQNVKKKDFGNFKLGSISGLKYNDLNGNGHKEPNEPGISGITIKLKNPQGATVSTVTGADGSYSFANLGPGKYSLSEVVPSGWRQTEHPGTVRIVSATTATKENFGNTQKPPKHGHDGDHDDN